MTTTTAPAYARGTIVIDTDGDALRIIVSEPHGYIVNYRGDRIWVARDTVEHDARVHFRIHRDADYAEQGAPWFVTSDTPDPDGDHTWGHFPTHAEAIAFVGNITH